MPTGIFDCHHHYGSLVFSEPSIPSNDSSSNAIGEEEVGRRLGWMDDLSIDAAVIMPVNRYMRPDGASDTQAVNDAVAAYRDAHNDRFPVALGITEPLHGKAGLAEIARLDEELQMVGVSYHTRWQGVATDDPWVLRGLSLLQDRKMLPFIHAYAESTLEAPHMVARLAEEFPDLPIVVTDAMSGASQSLELLDNALRHPNLYFETSCAYNLGVVERYIKEIGVERMLFGTDTYSTRVITTLVPSMLRRLPLDEPGFERLFGGNLLQLLRWTGRWQGPQEWPAKGDARSSHAKTSVKSMYERY